MRAFPAKVAQGTGVIATLMVVGLMLSGCAGTPLPGCKTGAERPTAQLVFGRVSETGHGVSEADFARFLDEEVSTRFPDGLTVVDAQGRWTPPAGTTIHDPSKMVMLVLRGRDDERAKLEAIREAYKRRYHQQSVLLMTSNACVSY